ncbi:MAG: PIG-L family deacetylase [Acidobacteriota bacterium]|nr:MAG: PIG-L family deacetylase [Acidobacteriota bacterium]
MKFKKFTFVLILFLYVSAFLRLEVPAQVRPVHDRGAAGLIKSLDRLNTSASVLMIGAHPDDEDTALLAYLARGLNARTAYLSLTRGDGGQNIIGPELGEALGVIRTEELLQARTLDGAEQYFTRAYDYGFSKTLAEAREKWDEQAVLCDAVRVIRTFRPLVVVSQFSGTPADGHGHHQFSGYITPKAIEAAADQRQCSDAGTAWQVQKFYRRHGFRATGEPQLRVNAGVFDPVVGRSYFEIAMEARSQHKSQEQGVLELRGDQFSGLNRVGSDTSDAAFMDGIDLSLRGYPRLVGMQNSVLEPHLEEMAAAIEEARSKLDVRRPSAILPLLVRGYKAANSAEWSIRHPILKDFFKDKQEQFRDAIARAAAIRIDALAEREAFVAGEPLIVDVRAFFEEKLAVNVDSIKLTTPRGWTAEMTDPPAPPTQQGFFRRETGDAARRFTVTASDTEPSQPYWLRKTRTRDVFDWDAKDTANTLSFQSPVMQAELEMTVLGEKIKLTQPVEFRFADDIRGEVRRRADVVPKLTLSLNENLLFIPISPNERKLTVTLTITNHSRNAVTGAAGLTINGLSGTQVSPRAAAFEIKRTGERLNIPFEIIVPANAAAGRFSLSASATAGDAKFSSQLQLIEYPHITSHRIYRPAETPVVVADIRTTPVKIGYIPGSGDRIPEALRQMGFDVTTITESELAGGDLSPYDTIVVGIRAYQVRPDLVANNRRLTDFMNAGGTLVVQYQLTGYAQQNLAPFPMQMGPRTADEDAKVVFARPEHPILNTPNKITDADFAGWVQERNLYNFSTMDERYVGLLETHDPNEAENFGGLVVADVGRGKYVYCSYSMFRQLPAGVPGAYRLFANIVGYRGN